MSLSPAEMYSDKRFSIRATLIQALPWDRGREGGGGGAGDRQRKRDEGRETEREK